MKITKTEVENYLALVEDLNPIHVTVVPGQYVVQRVMIQCGLTWQHYTVDYKQPIYFNDELEYDVIKDATIKLRNQDNQIKLVIRRLS
ncbi:hypothetical protein BU607_10120 [Staphylococcus auricularis]|uniref:Phage protein n=1 Tax=Staphylococcus auricularis TaxID=29379 RepID=A0ABX5IDM7_9STAP|nr:hypothetical protein BU607_10120 [Staphylococcus auricularis]PTH25299.1 hypothetical protein BU608_08065 [Staphylococcus auricularis]